MTSNGFRVPRPDSTEPLRFPASCGFICDLQLVPLVFAPSTGSEVRRRIAVRHPFLALISCKAHGLIAAIDLPACHGSRKNRTAILLVAKDGCMRTTMPPARCRIVSEQSRPVGQNRLTVL